MSHLDELFERAWKAEGLTDPLDQYDLLGLIDIALMLRRLAFDLPEGQRKEAFGNALRALRSIDTPEAESALRQRKAREPDPAPDYLMSLNKRDLVSLLQEEYRHKHTLDTQIVELKKDVERGQGGPAWVPSFVRVFRLPIFVRPDYRFTNGMPMPFVEVDGFRDDQGLLATAEGRRQMEEFIRGKKYFRRTHAYLVLHPTHSLVINCDEHLLLGRAGNAVHG